MFYGLGTGARDGQWHTFVRDLQTDLDAAQPGVIINEVNSFLIRGNKEWSMILNSTTDEFIWGNCKK